MNSTKLVWNKKEDRIATIKEIEALDAEKKLIIDYWMTGKNVGKVWIEVSDSDYELRELNDES